MGVSITPAQQGASARASVWSRDPSSVRQDRPTLPMVYLRKRNHRKKDPPWVI